MATFLPMRSRRDYELPLLRSLQELGGSAVPGDELYQRVADKLGLTPQDTEFDVVHARDKWVYTLQWVRYNLVREGDLDGSRRGVWALTEQGGRRLAAQGTTEQGTTNSRASAPLPAIRLPGPEELSDIVSGFLADVLDRRIDFLCALRLEDLLGAVDFCRYSVDPPSYPQVVEDAIVRCLSSHDTAVFAEILFQPLAKKVCGRNAPPGDVQTAAYWQSLTGSADFYVLLLSLLPQRPVKGSLQYQNALQYSEERSKLLNRMLREFGREFVNADGTVAWDKLAHSCDELS